MAKSNALKKFLLFVILIIVGVILAFIFSIGFLTYEQRVPANVLVVEGWMPDYGLYKAFTEYQQGEYDYILISGGVFPDFITLYINSFLIFHPHEGFLKVDSLQGHEMVIHAESTLGSNDSAHFVLWVNDQPIAQYYTTQQQGVFAVKWEGNLAETDSLMIQFDNDQVSSLGDRNLRITKFSLDGRILTAQTATLILDRGVPFGRYRRNLTATSYAELAAHYFIDQGVDPENIIAVTNHYDGLRRTFGNALALKTWLESSDLQVTGINVVSMDYHSRRTWLTYNKLLGNQADIGIISSEYFDLKHSARKRNVYIFKETLALLYYAVFVLPWA